MKALASVGLAMASLVACAFVGCAPASTRSSSSRPGAAAEAVSPSVSDSSADAPLATPTEGSTPPTGWPCDGIEILGTRGTSVLDTDSSGGLVEWLVRLRNRSRFERTVTFGWRDRYGREKSAEVRIRGGELVSSRVEVAPTNVFSPVTDLRLLSCE